VSRCERGILTGLEGKDGKGSHCGGISNHGILTILGSYVKGNHAQHGVDLYNDGSWSADSNSTMGKVG